jgi:hypothetical protein
MQRSTAFSLVNSNIIPELSNLANILSAKLFDMRDNSSI